MYVVEKNRQQTQLFGSEVRNVFEIRVFSVTNLVSSVNSTC